MANFTEFQNKIRSNPAVRNYVVYAALLHLLVATHFLVAGNPEFARSPEQAKIFEWGPLTIISALGLLGVFFLNKTNLRGFWDLDLSVTEKLIQPMIIGLAIGFLMMGSDMVTKWTHALAAIMNSPTIHISFPLSVPVYTSGALLVSIIYFLILIPLIVWLVSGKILKGKFEGTVYWSIATPLAFVEPLTQGAIPHIAGYGIAPAISAIEDLLLNLAQVWYLRRAGFVAAVVVRIAFYVIWHMLYGVIDS